MAEVFPLDDRARPSEAPADILAPEADVRALAPGLLGKPVIGLAFPQWRDGRGYSSARILRELGFSGDIRAIGDLVEDQLVFLKRSGFSSLAPERALDSAVAARALTRFAFVYQRAADGAEPAWALRHRGPALAEAAE
ncbi:MAG: DUF934 domain-containing protein [Allosphingosinicella sp.]